MSNQALTNKSALIYIFTRKFVRSFVVFTFITATFIAMILAYGVFIYSDLADPLFRSDFNWAIFVNQLSLPIVLGSLLYALIGTFARRNGLHVRIQSSGIEIHKGLFRKTVNFIPYSHIKQVILKQTIFEKVLNFSRVRIDYGGWDAEKLDIVSDAKASKLRRAVAKQTQAQGRT